MPVIQQVLIIKECNRKMKSLKQIGIWMDHANAHLIEYQTTSMEPLLIQSDLSRADEAQPANKGQKTLHHKQQQHEAAYYKKLADVIVHYQGVLLFGPTDAKLELFNYLKKDHHFDHIHIEVKQADKMTGNQQHAFVMEHFLVK
jgi:hypothetical protein